MITSNFRGWRKECTKTLWKNEILNCKNLEDFFYYNHHCVFDWKIMLHFISNRTSENWDYIWECEVNEYEVKEVIKKLICNFERDLREGKNEELEIFGTIVFDFIKILDQQILVLSRRKKYWELLRGVYNNDLNKIAKKKDHRQLIEGLWAFYYEEIRSKIWVERYNKVVEIKKERCLKDKRKSRREEVIDRDDKNENEEKNRIKKQKK
ncbi:hypothetical protein RhiirA5_429713 [Rhizophagus irregularis]|uniref:Uncharacterized protein n=1 Tax=Rhizophagus irregularis TaxID=588596 RepID=A0A2N0NXY6_9GLOM|nr:hypothetical protein RhiirA5_429713 [Rhizophagus irregularis]